MRRAWLKAKPLQSTPNMPTGPRSMACGAARPDHGLGRYAPGRQVTACALMVCLVMTTVIMLSQSAAKSAAYGPSTTTSGDGAPAERRARSGDHDLCYGSAECSTCPASPSRRDGTSEHVPRHAGDSNMTDTEDDSTSSFTEVPCREARCSTTGPTPTTPDCTRPDQGLLAKLPLSGSCASTASGACATCASLAASMLLRPFVVA